jgi:hypothetical protein
MVTVALAIPAVHRGQPVGEQSRGTRHRRLILAVLMVPRGRYRAKDSIVIHVITPSRLRLSFTRN